MGEDCKRGQNAQWSVILDKCTEISSKYRYRWSALFFNALSFCFDFLSFQTAHSNKNKLRTNWGWSSQKLRKMSLDKIYWFLWKKRVIYKQKIDIFKKSHIFNLFGGNYRGITTAPMERKSPFLKFWTGNIFILFLLIFFLCDINQRIKNRSFKKYVIAVTFDFV